VSPGVGYALLSLLAAGVLDVAYARYAGKRPVTGAYLFMIGGVIIIGQALAVAAWGTRLEFDARAAVYGIGAGAIVLVANALLMESLARVNVSLGSTIYRLNTIPVVLVALAVLGEALSVPKAAGVIMGVAAVVLLYQRGARLGNDRWLVIGTALAIAASLLRAAFGILSKIGLTGGGDPFMFMFYVGVGWTAAAVVYGAVRRQASPAMRELLPHAAIAGTLICIVVTFLLLGLRAGEASTVIPIANMSFVVALLTSAAFGMERLTRLKLFAVAFAAAAIVLLTRA
jgi:drug/metabolite transporter (DMT)-like permease